MFRSCREAQVTEPTEASGEERFRQILEVVGNPDPRDDIDTASLLRRFPALDRVAIEPIEIDGPHGTVQARSYRGPGTASAGLVWVHGGAFVAGNLDMPESHWFGLELAARGITVLALDYQKALNGVHHPVPSDEVLAGWLAATTDTARLGLPASELFLGGASAGATLATGAAVRLRGGEGPLPAGLVLVYPMLHSVLPAASEAAAAAAKALPHEARFDAGFVRAINGNYLGSAGDFDDPVAFPANGEAAGLPPTLIVNAEADDLRATGEAYGAQLKQAGVLVTMEFEPETTHGYLNVPGHPGALRTIDRIAKWLAAPSTR
jgi:acetyl esterase